MFKYKKQIWNEYDKTKSEAYNLKNDAIATKKKMDYIEEGIYQSSKSFEIGTVNGTDPDQPPSVSITESDNTLFLNFVIPKGNKGDSGIDGLNGKSAYEVALANGFVGSESEWLESLKYHLTDEDLDFISSETKKKLEYYIGKNYFRIREEMPEAKELGPNDLIFILDKSNEPFPQYMDAAAFTDMVFDKDQPIEKCRNWGQITYEGSAKVASVDAEIMKANIEEGANTVPIELSFEDGSDIDTKQIIITSKDDSTQVAPRISDINTSDTTINDEQSNKGEAPYGLVAGKLKVGDNPDSDAVFFGNTFEYKNENK